MIFNNKLFKENPLHLYSFDIVDNILKLVLINIDNKDVSTVFIVHNEHDYQIEVNSKDKVIEVQVECKEKTTSLETPIIKEAIIDGIRVNFNYSYEYLYIIQPKSIASMKDEKYLYIQKMVKYNGCKKENVKCYSDQFKDYWHCSCGSVNLNCQDECISCGIDRNTLFTQEIDNSVEEIETRKIVKSNLYILAWFAIICFIQFIIVDTMFGANIVFETKLASSTLGIILRFILLPVVIILSIGIVLARKRYLLPLVKGFEIARMLTLLFLNVVCNSLILKTSYIFFVFVSLDLVFIPFYFYHYFKVNKKVINLIASSALIISLISGVGQEIYYSQYDLTIEKEGLSLVIDTQEEKYVVPNTINNISVTGIYFDSSYDYSNLKELYINKDLKKVVIANSRVLPSLSKIVIDEENDNFYLDQNILFSNITNDVALVPASTKEIVITWDKVSPLSISDCPNLEKVTISKNVKEIGRMAFANCENLKTIEFEDNSSLSLIEENAFYYCTSLKEVKLPKSIQKIKHAIFYGCSSLEKVSTPFVGERRYYTHESSNTDVAAYLFGAGYNFDQIENVNVKEIEITDQPLFDNVTFYNCKADKIIIHGEALLENESLGKNAFFNCFNLTSFVVPEGISEILEGCFRNCENLETITLPKSLKTIHLDAFENCKSLKKVIYLGENFEEIDIKDGNGALKSAFSYTY